MKFAVLICLAAFACVAQAWTFNLPSNPLVDFANEKLEEAKQKVSELTTQASDLLKQTVDNAEDLTVKLEEGAKQVKESVTQPINEVVESVENAVREIEEQAKEEGVKNVTECTSVAQTLREVAQAVIANTIKCVTDKVDTGKTLVTDILTRSKNVFTELNSIKNEIEQCDKSKSGALAAVSALTCLTSVGAKASTVVVKQVLTLASDLRKITTLLSTLQPSLTLCVSKNAISTLREEAQDILTNIKECVSSKAKEAQTNTA